MATTSSQFAGTNLNVYFQSKRAGIDSNAVAKLVQFIRGAKHSLDVAIYDLKNGNVLTALKDMSSKVQLRILFDGGTGAKVGGGSVTVDPKSPSASFIHKAGLDKFSQPVHDKGRHLMHDKFIVRDGASVWTGSGNFTNGGLLLQDNNFLAIDSSALAGIYLKTFGDLASPGHGESHTKGSKGVPKKVKVGSVSLVPMFSTQFSEAEGIESAIVDALKGAKKVRLIAMLVSDPGILNSLFALKNIDIKGVLDPHEMKQVMKPPKGHSKLDPKLFWFANGDKRFVGAPSHAFNGKGDKNDFMHNKVLIIDDRLVITGSYNFSENAELNDENLLFIESPGVAAAYDKYFNAMFAQYKKHGAALPLE